MSAWFALLLAAQAGPRIESVDRLSGDARRPVLWTALKVVVSSPVAFEGRVEARSSFNFSSAVPLRIAAGGRATVLLPALDPEVLVVGEAKHPMPKDLVRADRVVLVDRSLPYADGLRGSEGDHLKVVASEDLAGLPPPGVGILEAVDLVVAGGPKAEVQARLEGPVQPPLRFPAIDAQAWSRAPGSGWVESKRSGLVYLALAYAALALGFYGAAGMLPAKARAAALGALPLAALGLSFLLVPSGSLTVTAQSIHWAGDPAIEGRLWFVGSERESRGELEFPRLVKPVFPTAAGAEEPFTLVWEGGRTRIEGLKLRPGRPACFAGTLSGKVPEGPRFGEVRWVRGTLAPVEQAADPDVAAWSPRLLQEGAAWFLDQRERTGGDLKADGIAESRERRRIVLDQGAR